MKSFGGNILFLDRSDINTDEIIPAKYLTEISKEALKPHLLEDLKLPGFDARRDIPGKTAVMTRANFGCGSSREHAPWALEVNGFNVVVAKSLARIFRQNMFNCGLLAIELPDSEIDDIFSLKTDNTAMNINFDERTLFVKSIKGEKHFSFTLSEFDAELVNVGGWVEFADKRY